MKYLKKFKTNADYQTYRGGGDWVTPNVSLIEENVSGNEFNIVFEPFVNTDDSITFPVYLTEGDNGQLGKDVHSYILSKFYEVSNTSYVMTETIYVDDMIVESAYSNAPLEAAHNADINLIMWGGPYNILRPTGVVISAAGH